MREFSVRLTTRRIWARAKCRAARSWRPRLGIVLPVIAIAAKGVVGYCIPQPRRRQAAIGLSMVPRGETGKIFAQLALANAIVAADIHAVLLIVIAATTALPPIALKWLYARPPPP